MEKRRCGQAVQPVLRCDLQVLREDSDKQGKDVAYG